MKIEKQPTANSKQPTVLITGAKGQLGHKLISVLGTRYLVLSTDSDTMDITQPEEIATVFEKKKPDFVIHAAAYTKVDAAEENKELCQLINATGSANVAKEVEKIGATLIYISTDYVFDGKKDTPYTEKDKPNPLSI
ncbi:MAG TPA: sugar nucleotide-binding protein, partial [bacterium]|nr:sugar nucleotide-binding protein [bacterium]